MNSQNSPTQHRIINCPQCKKETFYAPENKWRPFCGERCYKIDLGAWATEDYKIPSSENDIFSEDE